MLKIFAKVGTNEKALVPCTQEEVEITQTCLNKQHGGSWIWVDKIYAYDNESIIFTDGQVYNGFDNRKARYSDAIKKLR
jgi:hypothetical protein